MPYYEAGVLVPRTRTAIPPALNKSNYAGAPWWNAYGAKAPPRALIFFHVPKCGGTTVVRWMTRHNPEFTLKLSSTMSTARLFLSLHSDIFSATGSSLHARRENKSLEWPASAGPRPRWEEASVGVEVHSQHAWVWHRIEAKLQPLRERYARVNGRLLTLILLRPPEAQLPSLYRQQPPVNKSGGLVSFREWLPCNRGLMTRALIAGDTDMLPALAEESLRSRGNRPGACRPDAGHKMFYPDQMHGPRIAAYSCPSRATARAKAHLHAFDVWGLTEDIPGALQSVRTALFGAPLNMTLRVARTRYAIGTDVQSAKLADARIKEELEEPETQATMQAVVDCDRPLWEHYACFRPCERELHTSPELEPNTARGGCCTG
mmetsp:Transcript_10037/g.31794  ORF Transcript_10037/g.31794 Transcript_10037/m.31794 type:complete len:376 (-) Transcript_10037:126-1253(-)